VECGLEGIHVASGTQAGWDTGSRRRWRMAGAGREVVADWRLRKRTCEDSRGRVLFSCAMDTKYSACTICRCSSFYNIDLFLVLGLRFL
jgi:hypothetical protein